MRKSFNSSKFFVRTIIALVSCMPVLAFAHHPLGGMMPASFSDGLLSGIGHPIIGLDHLAFIIAAGIFAWKIGKPLVLMSSFIGGTAVGCLLVSYGISFGVKEPLILASVALMGFALVQQKLQAYKLAVFLYPLAGLLHGSAYGESVIGAEATPIVAYLLGFALIQLAIAFAAAKTVKLLGKGPEQAAQFAKIAGAVVIGIALTYGFELAETAILPAI